MIEKMTKKEIEYWNERSSEPLRFEPYPEDVCDAYNRAHPLPSEDEVWRIVISAQR